MASLELRISAVFTLRLGAHKPVAPRSGTVSLWNKGTASDNCHLKAVRITYVHSSKKHTWLTLP